jgi:hypothetical protein
MSKFKSVEPGTVLIVVQDGPMAKGFLKVPMSDIQMGKLFVIPDQSNPKLCHVYRLTNIGSVDVEFSHSEPISEQELPPNPTEK